MSTCLTWIVDQCMRRGRRGWIDSGSYEPRIKLKKRIVWLTQGLKGGTFVPVQKRRCEGAGARVVMLLGRLVGTAGLQSTECGRSHGRLAARPVLGRRRNGGGEWGPTPEADSAVARPSTPGSRAHEMHRQQGFTRILPASQVGWPGFLVLARLRREPLLPCLGLCSRLY